jgi:hypothetical protein
LAVERQTDAMISHRHTSNETCEPMKRAPHDE